MTQICFEHKRGGGGQVAGFICQYSDFYPRLKKKLKEPAMKL